MANADEENRNAFKHREAWLQELIAFLRPLFIPLGCSVPENMRITCGLPSRRAFAKHPVIGECWSYTASRDGCFEIMISPRLDQPLPVANVTIHELIHATVGLECGHRGAFAAVARGLGLEGPLTATVPGDELRRRLAPILEALGPYPHAALVPGGWPADGRSERPAGRRPEYPSSGPPKQGTRLLKCQCANCGYVARVTRMWIEKIGRPHCPHHGAMALVP